MATYTQLPIVSSLVFDGNSVVIDTDTYTAPHDLVESAVMPGGSWVKDTRTYTAPHDLAGEIVVPGGTWVEDTRTYTAPHDLAGENVVPGGVPIPTGNFRDVMVYVEDEDGNPLKDAIYVQSGGLFPTAARVNEADDGRVVARMWLLHFPYDDLVVVGSSGKPGVEYYWYDSVGTEPVIDEDEREATVQFERKVLKGNDAGSGFQMGGSLRVF